MDYYIIDVSGEREGDLVMFWRANDSGYTTCLDEAGKYSAAQVESASSYYNNGAEAIAVPCEVIEFHAKKFVYRSHDICKVIRDSIKKILAEEEAK